MWTEANLLLDEGPSESLLIRFAMPLVETLRPRFASWHFLWEPDLWLRFRWRSPDDAALGERTLCEALDRGQREGLFRAFRLTPYEGDAAMYGEEMWPAVQRDFTNGSELASSLIALEMEGKLTKERDYQWARHVHIITNQLYRSRWSEEARLCIRQARYRAWLLRNASPARTAEIAEAIAHLEQALARVDAIASAEDDLQTRWRAAGRPDIVAFLNLPPDFDRDPGKH